MRAYTKRSEIERFREKWIPHPVTRCWIWTAAASTLGYGRFADGSRKTWLATRMSWKLYNGELPDELGVLHKCDNPRCVNPEHLFLGSQQDNADDMKRKDRQSRGEHRHNAKLTWKQVREIRSSSDPAKEIAPKFGVSKATVWMIRSNKIWKEAH